MKFTDKVAQQEGSFLQESVPILFALLQFFVCTQFDLGMVENVLKAGGALNYIDTYWVLTYQLLFPFWIISMTLALRDVRYALYEFDLIYTGWLDVYYYTFRGYTMPKWLPWMWGPVVPSSTMVYLVGTGALLITMGIDYYIRVTR